jgi:hypothetical protein
MIRSRRFITGFALALGLLSTTACVVRTSGHVRVRGAVVVREAPPEPQYEEITVREGYVWVRGNWVWQNRWVWQPGHWERVRAGHTWNDGRWEQRGGEWHWVEGGWVTGGAHGTVHVKDNGGGHDHGRPDTRDHRDGGGGGTVTVVVDGPTAPPPARRAENPGSRGGYVWVMGRWDWKNNQWEWIPGHWERARAKKRWRDGDWVLQGNVYVWVEGGWDDDTGDRPKTRDHR